MVVGLYVPVEGLAPQMKGRVNHELGTAMQTYSSPRISSDHRDMVDGSPHDPLKVMGLQAGSEKL